MVQYAIYACRFPQFPVQKAGCNMEIIALWSYLNFLVYLAQIRRVSPEKILRNFPQEAIIMNAHLYYNEHAPVLQWTRTCITMNTYLYYISPCRWRSTRRAAVYWREASVQQRVVTSCYTWIAHIPCITPIPAIVIRLSVILYLDTLCNKRLSYELSQRWHASNHTK